MFENLGRFFKRMVGTETKELDVASKESKETAKERLHLVLMQDRANVSADFLELMKQEIIDVIKKYIEVDEDTIDVRLTTKTNEDGSNGTPALYANIPILNIRNDMKVENYNFELVSDGSIIAHKIEEPAETEEVEKVEEEITVEESKIIEEKIDSLISENLEGNENTFVENVNEFDSEIMDSGDFSKIEERQENLVNEIIPAIENIAQIEAEAIVNADNELENTTEVKNDLDNEVEEISKVDTNQEIENKLEESKEEQKEIENKKDVEKSIKIEENTKEDVSANSEELTIEAVQQLKKSCKRGRPKKKDKKNKKANTVTTNVEMVDDEEDDDVTFDDLLKKAEEEDRRMAEQEKKEVK